MFNSLKGLVRKLTRPFLTSEDSRLGITQHGALLITQDLPDLSTLVNEGVVWTVGQATATAAVTNLPTTTAVISLYNDEPDDGKSYLVLAVFGFQTAAPAALDNWSIAHCINMSKPGTLPTADITTASVKGLKARQGSYPGRAIVDLAATVTDDLWKPVGRSSGSTAVNSATGVSLYVSNKEAVLPVIPPGGMYSLANIATSASVTNRLGFVWAEVQMPR